MNPGTINNNERTGDRDLYFSWVMRRPKSASRKLRSCDYDSLPELAPSIICDKCSLPILLIEATRKSGFKATRYTQMLAKKIGIEAYLVRHSGVWGNQMDGSDRQPSPSFEITRLRDGANQTAEDEEQFISWLERKFETHWKACVV